MGAQQAVRCDWVHIIGKFRLLCVSSYLKKFLKIFPGVNLLRIVAGSVFELIAFKSSDNCLLLASLDVDMAAVAPLLLVVVLVMARSGMLDELRDDSGTVSFSLLRATALPPRASRRWSLVLPCGGKFLNAPN